MQTCWSGRRLRAENARRIFPETAVDAVGKYDEIGGGNACVVAYVGLEPQDDTEFPRPFLQDQ